MVRGEVIRDDGAGRTLFVEGWRVVRLIEGLGLLDVVGRELVGRWTVERFVVERLERFVWFGTLRAVGRV